MGVDQDVCSSCGAAARQRTRAKVTLSQDGGNVVIATAEGKGDLLVNGRSLKGLFATVADLEDDVNAMTTVGALLFGGRVLACAGAPVSAARSTTRMATPQKPPS